MGEAELYTWVEHSNVSVYRRDILRRAHKTKLIEYNAAERTAEISPLGVAYVEGSLLE